MVLSPEGNSCPNPISGSDSDPPSSAKKRQHHPRSPELWLGDQQALKHAFLKMQLQSLSSSTTPPSDLDEPRAPKRSPESNSLSSRVDYASQLSDELLLKVFSKLPESRHISNSLVCKRWSRLSGRLVRSIKLLDWDFLESGRLVYRFPNLTSVDIVKGCMNSPRNSGILLTNKFVSVNLNPCISNDDQFVETVEFLDSDSIANGLKILSNGCPNLRKIVLFGANEEGLAFIAEKCQTLQELELHSCGDLALNGIFGCRNLQILKLIGCVEGLYDSVITDVALTILAQGCRRLVELELVGCEGSFDGIKAIGQCCQMLEELTLCDHRMDGGWLSALSYCGNLKTLKLQSCKVIDSNPGLDEHLGTCPALERMHLQRCQMREKEGARALFLVCESVKELVFEDCGGLDDNIFAAASICRRVKFLSLNGCSILKTEALESVVLTWNELERLRVVSCNNIKDDEVTPDLAELFSSLRELKWRPNGRSLLSLGLAGTGIGERGGRFFQ